MVADLAPHNSHLNKAFCMSSDAIQPVANTDYLSASSVRYLYRDILPKVSHLDILVFGNENDSKN